MLSLLRLVVIISVVALLFVFYKSNTVLNGKGSNEEHIKPKIPSIENDDSQYDKPIATRNFDPAIENMINLKKEKCLAHYLN